MSAFGIGGKISNRITEKDKNHYETQTIQKLCTSNKAKEGGFSPLFAVVLKFAVVVQCTYERDMTFMMAFCYPFLLELVV
jgi:hypothetical protein